MATLYIVSAPVDNLEDISLRALRVLGEVDFILGENTRLAAKLLAHYNIKTPMAENKAEKIISLLAGGKDLALVSDAGLPGISDPGGKLIQRIIEKFSAGRSLPVPLPVRCTQTDYRQTGAPAGKTHESSVQIEFIPGPSAVTASLAISGLSADKFIFMGWPPREPDRQDFIRRILESDYPAIVYELRPGLEPFLEELKKAARENREVNKKGELETKPLDLTLVVVGREIAKMRETVYRGEIDRIIEKIKENENDSKGEFMVIIGKVN